MARQTSFITIEGTIGRLNFQKTADGYRVKQKGGVSASRIASDPAFQRTRENGAEFGTAGKAGKLLRKAMGPHLVQNGGRRMISRLVKILFAVLKTDSVSPRGQRKVQNGNIDYLQDFDFNSEAPLSAVFAPNFEASIDRATGTYEVSIPAFVPKGLVKVPPAATHFRLFAVAADIDFGNATMQNAEVESVYLPINQLPTAIINLNMSLTANSTGYLFLALGIESFQEVNGLKYPMNDAGANAMRIVKVD